MKAVLQNRWLLFSLRLILGVIFIVASISKIQDLPKFVSTVVSYGILPDSLAHLYGYVAPWVELFVGGALILGVFVRFSAAILIPLIISFIAASSYALVNAVGGSCGCFGKFFTLSHPVALTIDVLMLLASIILLLNKGQEFLSVGRFLDNLMSKKLVTDRLAGKRNFVPQFIRVSSLAVVIFVIGFGAIVIHNLVKQPEPPLETINIPAPLATDVDAALLQHKPVIMEFYIEGCHLCQAAAPVIYDMEKKFINRTVFLRIDYNQYYQNPEVISDFSITNIPTVLVIASKNSEGKYNILGRFEGTIERDVLRSSIEQAINSQ
jgi:uncharacterized membrane protein YphA (DoxX/SURF4 family)/thiol-disulfide isomerase/thioredoxin